MTLESLILNKAHMLQLLTVFGQKAPSDSKQTVPRYSLPEKGDYLNFIK